MIAAGIVEVDGELHQPQAKDATVKVDVLLSVSRDCRDVMNAWNDGVHGLLGSINDSPFIEHNRKRSPLAGLDIPCAMTAARYIFHQQDFASSQGAATAVRHLELYCSVKQHNELPLRRIVPIIIVVGVIFSKDHGFCRKGPRKQANLARIGQLNLYFAEMSFPSLVRIDPNYFHTLSCTSLAAIGSKYDRAAASSSSLTIWGMPGYRRSYTSAPKRFSTAAVSLTCSNGTCGSGSPVPRKTGVLCREHA